MEAVSAGASLRSGEFRASPPSFFSHDPDLRSHRLPRRTWATYHLVAIHDTDPHDALPAGFQAEGPRWENRELRRPCTRFTKGDRDRSDIIRIRVRLKRLDERVERLIIISALTLRWIDKTLPIRFCAARHRFQVTSNGINVSFSPSGIARGRLRFREFCMGPPSAADFPGYTSQL